MELEDNPCPSPSHNDMSRPGSADTLSQKANKPKSFFFGFFVKKPASDSKNIGGREGDSGKTLTTFIPQRTPKKAETAKVSFVSIIMCVCTSRLRHVYVRTGQCTNLLHACMSVLYLLLQSFMHNYMYVHVDCVDIYM